MTGADEAFLASGADELAAVSPPQPSPHAARAIKTVTIRRAATFDRYTARPAYTLCRPGSDGQPRDICWLGTLCR